MKTLEGKVAMVTGASRGLGAAIARRLAREGANVGICARNPDLLEKVAAQIEEAGAEALWTACDVTNPDEIESMASRTLERFGRVDILVNNAGAITIAPFLEETDEQWGYMLDVNLNSARWVTRAFLPAMIDGRGGKVIFMSSNAAKKGFINDTGYSVAKAGLMALTKVLAVEFGTKGIETFAVHPGLVAETDMGDFIVEDHIQRPEFEGSREKFWEWANPLSPTGFHPTVKEIEDVVAFLASPGSTVLTGTCITADHGFTPY